MKILTSTSKQFIVFREVARNKIFLLRGGAAPGWPFFPFCGSSINLRPSTLTDIRSSFFASSSAFPQDGLKLLPLRHPRSSLINRSNLPPLHAPTRPPSPFQRTDLQPPTSHQAHPTALLRPPTPLPHEQSHIPPFPGKVALTKYVSNFNSLCPTPAHQTLHDWSYCRPQWPGQDTVPGGWGWGVLPSLSFCFFVFSRLGLWSDRCLWTRLKGC